MSALVGVSSILPAYLRVLARLWFVVGGGVVVVVVGGGGGDES